LNTKQNGVWYSNGQSASRSYVVTIQNPDHSNTGQKSQFQIVLDKMAAICLDFEWSGFWISNGIQILDHWASGLFSTI
jgi:hypothetical protein